jgi:hypothetical protein
MASSPMSMVARSNCLTLMSLGDQAVDQAVDHDLGAAVHGHVGHQGLVLDLVRSPILVRVEDEFWPPIDGAVAGRDDLGRHGVDLLQVGRVLLAEGHHDLGVVALGRKIHVVLVVGVQGAGGEVRAEEIAGEEDLVLAQEAEHGLGPVHPGREHELQAAYRRDPARRRRR